MLGKKIKAIQRINSRAQKLWNLANHPNTPENEKIAAEKGLERMQSQIEKTSPIKKEDIRIIHEQKKAPKEE